MRRVLFLAALAAAVFGQGRNDLMCVTRRGNALAWMWSTLRQQMEGPGGETYAAQLKGANLPTLPATILSAAGTAQKPEFLISIGDGKTPDAVIRLQAPWNGKTLQPGTELEFAGKGVELRREPFRLIVDVDPANITLAARAERDKGSICECHTEDEWRRIKAGEKIPPR